MKAAAPARTKHGPFKTMPLRWSFGPREKRAGASAELVEYLESRRRPRSTSQSIVPLLTGAAGGDEKSASPRPNGTASAKAEDGGGASERALSTVPCPQGHPCPGPVPGNPARKLKDHASQDIRLPKKFDLPLAVMPSMESERPARPEGQRGTSWKGSGHVGSQSSPPSPSTGLSRDSRDSRRDPTAKPGVTAGDAERDRPFQGTRTLLRSVFWKKENRRIEVAEGSPPPGSGRLSPAVDLQARGSSPTLRDVQSAPSSLHLPRKASRPPRGSALGVTQRFVPGEQTPCGTLQRVKYHTLSLGRKKSLPESSF